MRRLINPIALVALAAGLLSVATIGSAAEEREIIEKTFRLDRLAGECRVIVDNVFGSIHLSGVDGEEVRVTARRTTQARSDRLLEEAKDEVRLDISERDGVIEFYVDGPFREKRRGCINWRGIEREGYKVSYDFEVEVPAGCAVEILTVNEGDISIESVAGDFEVSNVNGDIDMRRIEGSGKATTVNGDITLDFARNPQGDCRFATINGEVRLHFLPRLSADFYLKTFNGDIFTDFEVERLPAKTFASSQKNGRTVYKAGHLCGVRAGQGGPEIELDGFNGDMYILKK